MLLHLAGEVDYKMMDALVKSLNDLKENENLIIYFTSSEGGYVTSSDSIVSCINLHRDRIHMIFYGELFSCGMIIFLTTDCKKSILNNTTGMYHLANQKITIMEGGEGLGGYDAFALKLMRDAKKTKLASLKNVGLTKEEFNDIKNGKEVYFPHSRIKQILDYNG